MPLRDILVHLDDTPRCAVRLDLAAGLARRHGAHLTGLHVMDVALPVGIVPDASGAGITLLYEQLRATAQHAATAIEAAFRAGLDRCGIAGEWRLAEGLAGETLARHARLADLVVLGQDPPEGGPALVEAAIFGAGRPVLVVPFAGPVATLGERVLVGWNASREAARAVHDALPLLGAAAAVTVLVVNPRAEAAGDASLPGADLATHLARHGLRVTADQASAPGIGDGETLLNAAADLGADLLVVGAYGHSRLREMVMGGVTRTLLRSMTVPVLLSH